MYFYFKNQSFDQTKNIIVLNFANFPLKIENASERIRPICDNER